MIGVQQKKLAYFMVAPVVIILCSLIGFPLGYAIFLSFTVKHIGVPPQFVGIQNYVELVHSSIFRLTVLNTFIYTFISVLVKVILGVILALILNRIGRGQRALRGVLLLPWVIPTSLSALVWWWMYSELFGIINWTLMRTVVPQGIPWLSTPFWARCALIITNVWRGLPFFAITFLAGIIAIPVDLMDAVSIDGAGAIAKVRYVTLPLLAPLLSIVTLFSLVMTAGDFALVHIITHGGPQNTTHLFATLAQQIGFKGGSLGKGAAISLFIVPFLGVSAYLILKFVRKRIV